MTSSGAVVGSPSRRRRRSSSPSQTPRLSSSSSSASAARRGDVVTIDLLLTPENGYVPHPLFDDRGVVSFVLGWGNYLPGLHSLVEGMRPGDAVSDSETSVDAGWGAKDPELIVEIRRTEVEDRGLEYDKIRLGAELTLRGTRVVVTERTEDRFVVDANPPLAGSSYRCELRVSDVEPAPRTLEYVGRGEDAENDSDDGIGFGSRYRVASFGLGCFWAAELAYMRVPGVVGMKVGYTQGRTRHPTYDDVCSENTRHVEAVLVIYDPKIVSYERLLEVAFERLAIENDSSYYPPVDQIGEISDDRTSQYRHGIYYHDDEQRRIAKRMLGNVGDDRLRSTTELKAASTFYDAEDHHQQYLLKGGQSARKGARETIRCFG